MAERVFMKGTEAIAEAAARAGCRFFAGYPITPQNEIPEYMARRLPTGRERSRFRQHALRRCCHRDKSHELIVILRYLAVQ